MQDTLFTDTQYDEHLAELRKHQNAVSLDDDPVAAGLKSFNQKLAAIQGARERVSQIILEAIINKTLAQRLVNQAQNTYNASISHKLHTDTVVSTLKSADLRNAALNTLYDTEVKILQAAELDLAQADAFHKCAYAISKDLEVKNENLIQQIKTVSMMMNIDPDMREELRIKGQTT